MVLDLSYPLADLFLDEALAMDPALVKYQSKLRNLLHYK